MLMNMNALIMAEGLFSSCLILLLLGVKHLHNVIKPYVMKGGKETLSLFHLT